MIWLNVLYIPAACTSKLQPYDIVLNKTVKDGAATAYNRLTLYVHIYQVFEGLYVS